MVSMGRLRIQWTLWGSQEKNDHQEDWWEHIIDVLTGHVNVVLDFTYQNALGKFKNIKFKQHIAVEKYGIW